MQPAPRNLWIPLLIAGVILTGLIGSMFLTPYLVWGGIMVAMFGAIMLGYPRQVLFLFWVWAAFRPLIIQMVVQHPIVRVSNGAFVVVVIGIFVALYVLRRTDAGGVAGIRI